MKILLVNKYLMPKGGAETYVFEVGKQLEKMGHQVEYFGMDHPERIVGNNAGSYVSYIDFHKSGLSKLFYPFKIIYSREAAQKITRVLRDFKPDIVHLNNFNYQLTPSILYAVRRYEKKSGSPVKIVYTAHDPQLVCPNHMMKNPVTHEACEKCTVGKYRYCFQGKCVHTSTLRSFLGMVEGWLYHRLNTYRLIDFTVYPSQFLSEKMSSNPELKKNYAVLHNFITMEKALAPQKEDYVLFFGRYSYEKGLPTLVKACKALPDIPFKFAGSGELESEFAGVQNIENVGFQTGNVLYGLISKARFSVIPSECYENCPFSVLESIMLHTPVIGTRIGGIPELIAENETGLLFESRNDKELREKIAALWNNRALLERMTENCARAELETAQSYCEKLVDCYKNI